MAGFLYKGILLQQHKEPALSRELREFLNADTIGLRMGRDPVEAPDTLTPDEVVALAREAHVIDERDGLLLADKLERARTACCRLVVVDAIDDEPYISSQINPMLKNTQLSEIGLFLCQRTVSAPDACFAIYKNLIDIETKIARKIGNYPIIRLRGRYPAEYQARDDYREEDGVLLIGIGAVLHLARAVLFNKPQTTAFVTVAGDCIGNPTNLEVSLGMTVAQTLERCGLIDEPSRVVIGGSMTGIAVIDTDNTLVTPTTRAILAFRQGPENPGFTCIGCARCVRACPMGLNPFILYRSIRQNRQDLMRKLDAQLCISCGACSYMCPAKLNLSAMIQQSMSVYKEKHEEIQKSYDLLSGSKNAVYQAYLANHRFGKAVQTHRRSRRQLLRDLRRWEYQAEQEHRNGENNAKRLLSEAAADLRRAEDGAERTLAAAHANMQHIMKNADRTLDAAAHTRHTIQQSADRALRDAERTRTSVEHAADKMVQQSVDFQYKMSLGAVKAAERALQALEKAKEPVTSAELKEAHKALNHARQTMASDTQQAQAIADKNCTLAKQDALAAYIQAGIICERTKKEADVTLAEAREVQKKEYIEAQAVYETAKIVCADAKAAARVIYEQATVDFDVRFAQVQLQHEKAMALLRRKALIQQAIVDETLHQNRFETLLAAHTAAAAQARVSGRSQLPSDFVEPTHLCASERSLLLPGLRVPFDRDGFPQAGSDSFAGAVEQTVQRLLRMTPQQLVSAIEVCTLSLANPPNAQLDEPPNPVLLTEQQPALAAAASNLQKDSKEEGHQ